MKVKKPKASTLKEAHTSKTKRPYGDYTGDGVRNPVGKMRSGSVGVIPATKKQLGTPPKKLA